jgi:hypothetical protein
MNSSLLVAIVAIGIAAVFGFEAAGYPLEARRLPMLMAWIVGGLSVLMILEEGLKWRRRRRPAAGEATGAAVSTPVEPVASIVWSALIPFAVAIAAYIALIPIAGYLITTPVFLGGVLLVSRAIKPVTAIVVAITVTVAIWVIFIWLLRLPIPLLPMSS